MIRESSYAKRIVKRSLSAILGVAVLLTCSYSDVMAETENFFEGDAANGTNSPEAGTGGSSSSTVSDSSFTVLEITGDKRCSYVGYWFDGCEPLKIDEFDETKSDTQARRRELGGYAMDSIVNGITGNDYQKNYFVESTFFMGQGQGGDIPNALIEEGTYNGYFLNVGPNRGVYALAKDNNKIVTSFAQVKPGTGHVKLKPNGFKKYSDVQDWEKNDYYSARFNVSFKAEDSEQSGHKYYGVEKATKVGANKGNYKQSTKKINNSPVYEYVGNNKGDYDVQFVYNGSYNKYYRDTFYVVDGFEASDDGLYVPKISETTKQERADNTKEEAGYDFDNVVSSVEMLSRCYNFPSSSVNVANRNSMYGNFDYIWVDAETTETSTVDDVKKAAKGTKIFLKNYKKAKYYNNELFWTLVYEDMDTGKVGVPGTDGTHPAYEKKDGKYVPYGDGANLKGVRNWQNARNIQVITKTPEELRSPENAHYLDEADLIIIGEHGDGQYTQGALMYDAYYGTSGPIKQTQDCDFSFDQILKIYKRVVVDQDCAVCMSHLCKSDTSFKKNIAKLFYMLYNVQDKNADPSYGTTIECGSGRDFFRDFIPSIILSGNALDYESPNFKIEKAGDGSISSVQMNFVQIDESTGNRKVYNFLSPLKYEHGGKTRVLTWDSADEAAWQQTFDQVWLRDTKVTAKDEGGSYKGDMLLPIYYFYKGERYNFAESTNFADQYYLNAMCYNQTGVMFKFRNDDSQVGAKWFGKILRYRNPPYLTVEILNYDTSHNGGNKIIPINDYELAKMDASHLLPINFKIVSSAALTSLVITGPGLNAPITPVGGKGPSGYFEYNMTYNVSAANLTKSANTFTITANNGKKTGSDSVTVTIRDMFDLN